MAMTASLEDSGHQSGTLFQLIKELTIFLRYTVNSKKRYVSYIYTYLSLRYTSIDMLINKKQLSNILVDYTKN